MKKEPLFHWNRGLIESVKTKKWPLDQVSLIKGPLLMVTSREEPYEQESEH